MGPKLTRIAPFSYRELDTIVAFVGAVFGKVLTAA